MRTRKLAIALVGAAVILCSCLAVPASAASTVTVSPNPIPVTPTQTTATVTVSWQGQTPRTLMFVEICKKSISDSTFQEPFDCSALSEINPNGTPDGANAVQFDVFRGENPDGDTGWGCFAEGDTAPAGVEKFTTCYVRVTNNSKFNNDQDVETPYTFAVGGDVVPEAPIGILLPILGGLVAVGGFLIIRNRQTATS